MDSEQNIALYRLYFQCSNFQCNNSDESEITMFVQNNRNYPSEKKLVCRLCGSKLIPTSTNPCIQIR